MSLKDDLLPVFQIGRSVPGSLGFNEHVVEVVVRTWSGERPGLGTQTQAITRITEGVENPKVEEVSARDVLASGGLYQSQDLKIGPITPAWSNASGSGGTAMSTLDPAPVKGQSVYYRITGPRYPTGALFERVEGRFMKPTGYVLILRKTAQVPA